MNKTEWKREYRRIRLGGRLEAEKLFAQNPNVNTVCIPFLMPINPPPTNCEPVIFPLGDMEYDEGYLDAEGNLIYRTKSMPMGVMEFKRCELKESDIPA